VMLRKKLQRGFASNDRMDNGGLGVDYVILDFNKFIEKQTNDLQIQQQKEIEKQNQQQKIINIDGVQWKVDDSNERILKKNNPNVFINFNDILDHPNWDDTTKEKILNTIY